MSPFISLVRSLVLPLIIFGLVTNVAVLVSPLFMMHVLDKVVPSGNLNTLALLALLAAATLLTTSLVEFFRDKALSASGKSLNAHLTEQTLAKPDAKSVRNLGSGQSLADFLSGPDLVGCIDLVWLPLFFLALFLIHPAFLLLAIGAVLFFSLGKIITTQLSSKSKQEAAVLYSQSNRNLHQLEAAGSSGHLMSISNNLASRYQDVFSQLLLVSKRNDLLDAAYGSGMRLARTGVQIGSLATGAVLVTLGELTAGGMIGASIIMGKSIGTVEAFLGSIPRLKSVFVASRELRAPTGSDLVEKRTEIADLSGELNAVNLTYPKAAGEAPRIDRVSIKLKKGECLAILGEAGSGKTSLLNALSGVDAAPIGNCFFDQTDIRTLDEKTKANLIGYVPQNGMILPGTISENIARFSSNVDDTKVLAAARLAGIHGFVSALSDAYQTDLGEKPYLLTAGQKQRLAFARALYEPPKYLFMDEPNALLDHAGERQMGDAIQRLKENKTTIIFSAHRMGIVHLADTVLVLEDGRIADIGPKKDILGRLANQHRTLRVPISGESLQDLSDWVARQFVREGDEAFKLRATMVASELYNFTKANGSKSQERRLFFEFKFLDDVTCSVSVTENNKVQFEAKIHKVKKLVTMDRVENAGLEDDEKALAAAIQLSDNFEHRAGENKTAIVAHIKNDESRAAAG